MTGTLAAQLSHEGLFKLDDLVTTCLPELEGSGFSRATVRQVMDMTTAVGFPDDKPDPAAENGQYGVALGWCTRPADYSTGGNCRHRRRSER